jgi:predicted permease
LVNLSAPGPKLGSTSCNQAGDCEEVFSYPMFRDLERAQTAFTGIAAHKIFGANMAIKGQTPVSTNGMLVSGSYFPVLGLTPAIGRLFAADDDRNIGGHFVAVLSHSYWESRLGSSPDVVNQPIVINGQTMTIIGVAPRGFEGTTIGSQPSVFVPLTMFGLMQPGFRGFDNRKSYWAYLFARRKPGVTLMQARASINVPYRLVVKDVEAPLQKGMSDQTMARFKTKEIVLAEGTRGQSSVHTQARTPLTLLFGITGIVLLIACANIANLLLARAAGRSTEMAVRLSLGAARKQLLAQLLTESILLATLGGVASLVVARWTLVGINRLLPAEAAATLHAELRLPVILFAAALSIGTGLLFGMFPAIHSTRADLISTIRANAGQPAGARSAARFRTSLVTVQIALSMALLTSAGLFIKSLINVSRVDLGIKVNDVVTFGISPELNGYTPARSRALFERVEEELTATPGVTAVSVALVAVLAGNNYGSDVAVQGFKKGPDTDANARYNEISVGYFHTMGIPLLAGREFEVGDVSGSPRVALVNQAFAKKFNLGNDVVGKFMSSGGDEKLDVQIVGLVEDAKYSEVKQVIPPQFFYPYRQDSTVGSMNFYVRTSLDPSRLLRTLPAVLAKLDPNLPLENLKTLPQQVKENVFLDRMISTLAAAFAALATLLAAVGLYGVLAYTVAQRTREIGVRMALGAHGGQVRGLIVRQVGRMTLIGGVIGIAGALALGKAAQSLLFGLQGNDPVVLTLSTLLLAAVAFGAGYIPALRASRVHPMQALRYE